MTQYIESRGLIVPETEYKRLTETDARFVETIGFLQERIDALELSLEDVGWQRLIGTSETEFSREGLRLISQIARIFYLKNPIIKRGVEVKKFYVWGQGMSIRAHEDEINTVIQAFMDDPHNHVELVSHQARGMKEVDLEVDGNVFLVLFTNPSTGQVRVRSIPFDEIAEIISNPDDAKEIWYYKRSWNENTVSVETGVTETASKTEYYPDWSYSPENKPPTIGGKKVNWESPVYHIKVGGFSNWKFGISEIYSAIDWAKAYKEFLEDWATLTRAYSRFAWQVTTKGGKDGISKAKAKLGTTVTTNNGETNPSPTTGSTFIGADGVNLSPIRTAGATIAAEDGRRILLMVAAAVGLPETFFGDVSVGTLATATSLDRPTELAMRDRQTLWADVYRDVISYVLRVAVKMPNGSLAGFGQIVNEENYQRVEWNEDVDAGIDIDFPPVVAVDVGTRINAINAAAANLPDEKLIARMLLSALGEDDVDEIIDAMFPEGEEQPEGEQPEGDQEPPADQQAQEALVEAARALRQALVNFKERYAGHN
jgi:hypothetical protein